MGPLADIAVGAEDLEVVGIERQLGEFRARLDVVDVQRVGARGPGAAALAAAAMPAQRLIANGAPFVRGVEGDGGAAPALLEGRLGLRLDGGAALGEPLLVQGLADAVAG